VGSNLLVDANLGDCEGLHLRVKGDGQSYFVQVSQGMNAPGVIFCF
jgi:myo-inositol-hexaphosphate 3-phosphohydrolase